MAINKRYQWKLYFSTLKCNCNELFEYMLIRNHIVDFRKMAIVFHFIPYHFNLSCFFVSFSRTPSLLFVSHCRFRIFFCSLFFVWTTQCFSKKKKLLLNSKTSRIKNNKKNTQCAENALKNESWSCMTGIVSLNVINGVNYLN